MVNNRQTSSEPKQQDIREGGYKNIETSVNNPEYFDDSYKSQAEDEITEEESRTEKEQGSGKREEA